MRTLSADDIPTWVEEHLLATDRNRPIVAVTSHPRAARGWIDPEELQRSLGDLAEVVLLETGEPTWALSEALPPRLDVYGGAMRVWWPGLTRESDPYDHRLYFAYSLDEAQRAVRRAANEERANLVDQLRQARLQLQEARKALRSADDRHEAARKSVGLDDPLASERALLLAVRLAHARMFGEGDRLEHPLQRMRLGAGFLDSVRATEGVEIDKVVEVCAQAACGIAHTIAARKVHQLRSGPAGSASRVRESDGAQAWRCALQVNTPSARRLHWWSVPGPDGPTIEFASVDVHDAYGIPD